MAPEPTNIIITGASGLVGPALATRLLNDPQYRLVLTDIVPPNVPAGVAYPEHARCLAGDISSPDFVAELIVAAQPLHAVFIFHGIMSSGSEANYDLSVRVNLESVRLLLEHVRRVTVGAGQPPVRVVYASSQAVYGQPLPHLVTDAVTPTPQGTYGAHKLASEVYINEMHRRGFIDAVSCRFPTVCVRPGKPTQAASSFLSAMIREPMNGREAIIPLKDRALRSYLCTPGTLVENLVRVLRLDGSALPSHKRAINFPGIAVSIQELMDALAKYGGEDKLKLLKEETDEVTERIVRSWAEDFDSSTALGLGLVVDKSAEDIVKEYVDSFKK